MLSRAETTKLLSRLLERDILHSKYWSNEVSLRLNTPEECRVDYMAFEPANQSASGIEHGIFSCYEVKSCLDDFNSGHGLNFVGDKNYLVTTAETFSQLPQQFKQLHTVGIYIAIPVDADKYDEILNPTPLTFDETKFKMVNVSSCSYKLNRFHSLHELLFSMLRSGQCKTSRIIPEVEDDTSLEVI